MEGDGIEVSMRNDAGRQDANTLTTALLRAAAVIALASLTVFGVVTTHELRYAGRHPHAFGPAHVIAWGAAAGALLSLATGLISVAALRRGP
jgi:hypothetical protein